MLGLPMHDVYIRELGFFAMGDRWRIVIRSGGKIVTDLDSDIIGGETINLFCLLAWYNGCCRSGMACIHSSPWHAGYSTFNTRLDTRVITNQIRIPS